jgi:hypothetical protein
MPRSEPTLVKIDQELYVPPTTRGGYRGEEALKIAGLIWVLGVFAVVGISCTIYHRIAYLAPSRQRDRQWGS